MAAARAAEDGMIARAVLAGDKQGAREAVLKTLTEKLGLTLEEVRTRVMQLVEEGRIPLRHKLEFKHPEEWFPAEDAAINAAMLVGAAGGVSKSKSCKAVASILPTRTEEAVKKRAKNLKAAGKLPASPRVGCWSKEEDTALVAAMIAGDAVDAQRRDTYAAAAATMGRTARAIEGRVGMLMASGRLPSARPPSVQRSGSKRRAPPTSASVSPVRQLKMPLMDGETDDDD